MAVRFLIFSEKNKKFFRPRKIFLLGIFGKSGNEKPDFKKIDLVIFTTFARNRPVTC